MKSISMGRRWLSWLASAVVWWLALLAVFVPLPLTAPLSPNEVRTLDGRDFVTVIGHSQRRDHGLNISAMNLDEGALQVHRLDDLEAERFPVLRYRFEDFPRTLELVLIFRTSEQPDVVAVTIPTVVGSGEGTVDLATIPAWRGRVSEIGFAQYPGAQSVPPGSAFHPFTLAQAELESVSWRGALAARIQDWWGARNWALMSLSALGPDSAVPSGRSFVAFIFLGVAGSVALGVLFTGWRGRTLARIAILAGLAGWLVLDARWLHGLHARHAATRDAYAELSPLERQRRLPDQTVFDSAQMLRNVLSREALSTPVFVDAGSDFERARLLYHLLPMNVAPMNMIRLETAIKQRNVILVFYAKDVPRYDAKSGALIVGSQVIPADELFDLGPLRVYRLKGGPA